MRVPQFELEGLKESEVNRINTFELMLGYRPYRVDTYRYDVQNPCFFVTCTLQNQETPSIVARATVNKEDLTCRTLIDVRPPISLGFTKDKKENAIRHHPNTYSQLVFDDELQLLLNRYVYDAWVPLFNVHHLLFPRIPRLLTTQTVDRVLKILRGDKDNTNAIHSTVPKTMSDAGFFFEFTPEGATFFVEGEITNLDRKVSYYHGDGKVVYANESISSSVENIRRAEPGNEYVGQFDRLQKFWTCVYG
jgi:hypothetical protein